MWVQIFKNNSVSDENKVTMHQAYSETVLMTVDVVCTLITAIFKTINEINSKKVKTDADKLYVNELAVTLANLVDKANGKLTFAMNSEKAEAPII